jgi:hypothetical protein
MSNQNWQVNNNHFDSASNIYNFKQKYFFHDKLVDTMDSNDAISKIASAVSKNMSYIKEGLVVKQASTVSVRVSFGTFFHNQLDGSNGYVFNQPYSLDSGTSKTFLTNFKNSNSLLHVGTIYDTPVQSINSTELAVLHRVELNEGAQVDPTYGGFSAGKPLVYLASDAVRTGDSLFVSTDTSYKMTITGSSSTQTKSDYFVTYTPANTVIWTSLIASLNITTSSGTLSTVQQIHAPNRIYLSSDIGKYLEFTSGVNVGVRRRIIHIINNNLVGLDSALPSIPGVGDTFKIFDAEGVFPSSGTRYDIVGIRKKTYPMTKTIAAVGISGNPITEDPLVTRYHTTHELTVLEGATFVSGNINVLSVTTANAINFIPLAVIQVDGTAQTANIVSTTTPWILMFRDKMICKENLLTNGDFRLWDSTVPYAWSDIIGGHAWYKQATINPQYVKFGDYALQLTCPNGQSSKCAGQAIMLKDLGVSAGDTLVFSAFALKIPSVSGGNGRVRITLTNDNTDITSHIMETVSDEASTTSDFTLVSTSLTIPVTDSSITPNTYAIFYLDISLTNNSVVIFDGCVVNKIVSSVEATPHVISETNPNQFVSGNFRVVGNSVVDSNLTANSVTVTNILSGSSASFSGDLTVTGNLTINGTTTTVNTTNLTIKDNIITLNKNEVGNGVGGGSGTSGIEVVRGTQPTIAFKFNETTDRWEVDNGMGLFVPGTSTLSTAIIGSLTIISDLNAGNLKITGSSLTAQGLNSSINITPTGTGVINNSKTTYVSGYVSNLANVMYGNSTTDYSSVGDFTLTKEAWFRNLTINAGHTLNIGNWVSLNGIRPPVHELVLRVNGTLTLAGKINGYALGAYVNGGGQGENGIAPGGIGGGSDWNDGGDIYNHDGEQLVQGSGYGHSSGPWPVQIGTDTRYPLTLLLDSYFRRPGYGSAGGSRNYGGQRGGAGLAIYCKNLVIVGTPIIDVRGGNYYDDSSPTGSGGGGGGVSMIYYEKLTLQGSGATLPSPLISGGVGDVGSTGVNGSAGYAEFIQIS